MPTLDDALILQTLTAGSLVGALNPVETPSTVDEADLIQIFDVSTRTAKTVAVGQLMAALGIAAT